MIARRIASELKTLLGEYPVVTLLGPRQAGKTTLARQLEGYAYSNLELPETRELAQHDPKAYLGQFKTKVIIDEIQRVPIIKERMLKRFQSLSESVTRSFLVYRGDPVSLSDQTDVIHYRDINRIF